MSDYPAGTVAVATVRGVPNVRVYCYAGTSIQWVSAEKAGGLKVHHGEDVTDVRPLVVLDLPHGAKAGWPVVVNALKLGRDKTGLHLTYSGIIDQIEQQARPPKPVEPLGDGAVVEDANGYRWVRIAGPPPERESKPWRHRGHAARTWDHVSAVRVLSEGVS